MPEPVTLLRTCVGLPVSVTRVKPFTGSENTIGITSSSALVGPTVTGARGQRRRYGIDHQAFVQEFACQRVAREISNIGVAAYAHLQFAIAGKPRDLGIKGGVRAGERHGVVRQPDQSRSGRPR